MAMIQAQPPVDYYALELTDEEFALISGLVHRFAGIVLRENRKSLIVNRLRRKLQERGLPTYRAYYEQVVGSASAEAEILDLVDALTTNKTEFFRNQEQMAFLRDTALPDFAARLRGGDLVRVLVWSAGCATGEEPYSLALLIQDRLGADLASRFTIHATDISETALARAREGTYTARQMARVDAPLRDRFFTTLPDGSFRAGEAIRRMVHFGRVNLKEIEGWRMLRQHLIVCRNVLIYLDAQLQAEIVRGFWNLMYADGFLVLGHSEVIREVPEAGFVYCRPSIYRRLSGTGRA